MAILLPLVLLAGIFALALLAWPFTLARRVRHGHVRRRVLLWPIRVRRVGLGIGLVVYGVLAWWAAGDAPPVARTELLAGTGVGLLLGLASAVLARVEHERGALFLSPNRIMVWLVALVVLARLVWLARQWWLGDGAAAYHAVALGAALLAYGFAHAATLSRRLARARTL